MTAAPGVAAGEVATVGVPASPAVAAPGVAAAGEAATVATRVAVAAGAWVGAGGAAVAVAGAGARRRRRRLRRRARGQGDVHPVGRDPVDPDAIRDAHLDRHGLRPLAEAVGVRRRHHVRHLQPAQHRLRPGDGDLDDAGDGDRRAPLGDVLHHDGHVPHLLAGDGQDADAHGRRLLAHDGDAVRALQGHDADHVRLRPGDVDRRRVDRRRLLQQGRIAHDLHRRRLDRDPPRPVAGRRLALHLGHDRDGLRPGDLLHPNRHQHQLRLQAHPGDYPTRAPRFRLLGQVDRGLDLVEAHRHGRLVDPLDGARGAADLHRVRGHHRVAGHPVAGRGRAQLIDPHRDGGGAQLLNPDAHLGGDHLQDLHVRVRDLHLDVALHQSGGTPVRSTLARKLPGSRVRQLCTGAEICRRTACTSFATTSPGLRPCASTWMSVG